MSEVLQANIFFVITSIAVIVLTILVSIVLYYLVGILRNVREVTERLKRGSEQLAEDALEVRAFVRDGVIGTIRRFFTAGGEKKRSARGSGKKQSPEKKDDSSSDL